MKNILKHIIAIILEIEARLVIKKYRPAIITVTGSVGKTSAKDAIATVLRASPKEGAIRSSEKSFNSEFGLPLTILGCKNPWGNFIGWLGVMSHGIELIFFRSEFPACLVLEVGADHPGNIRRVARWLKPDVAVVTKIGAIPVHVEFFPTREALVSEKLSLARVVRSRGNRPGTLVLPADDADILAVRKEVSESVKAITYGINTAADVNVTSVEVIYGDRDGGIKAPMGISFKLNHGGNSIPVRVMNVLGVQHVFPLLAAVSVGIAREIPIMTIVESFTTHTPPPGRMNILEGLRGSTIIDDSYNASPDAMSLALTELKSLKTQGRKIAVIGDMMELGKFSLDEHKKIGTLAADVLKADENSSSNMLITIGQRAKTFRESAIAAGFPASSILSFDSSAEAAPEVALLAEKGDIFLIKGSQSTRMERIAKALLADPSKAADKLVRQDLEWLMRK